MGSVNFWNSEMDHPVVRRPRTTRGLVGQRKMYEWILVYEWHENPGSIPKDRTLSDRPSFKEESQESVGR